MATMSTSTVTAMPSSTSLPGASSGSTPGQSGSSNPLLFFVALGFGVLFTNLWIIIGVKYCFRYQNARRRGIPMNAVDGMAMGQMHHGRRRREKKLMTSEEVEAKFPQMTYKAWRALRAKMGLSTEGGVEAIGQEDAHNAREVLNGGSHNRAASIRTVRTSRSRANSMHSIEPIITGGSGVFEVGKDTGYDKGAVHYSEDMAPDRTDVQKGSGAVSEREHHFSTTPRRHSTAQTPEGETQQEPRRSLEDSGSITEAVDAEAEVDVAELQHLPEDIGAGDTCAICIDQLEDNDEVRGLTCGHAFHSSCVDVWLTTRRAICPLCKRDYWVRKSPAHGGDGAGALGDHEREHGATVPVLSRPFAGVRWRSYLFSRSRNNATPEHAEMPGPSTDLESGLQTTAAAPIEPRTV